MRAQGASPSMRRDKPLALWWGGKRLAFLGVVAENLALR